MSVLRRMLLSLSAAVWLAIVTVHSPPPRQCSVRRASGRGDFAPRDAALRVLAVAARRFAAPTLAAAP